MSTKRTCDICDQAIGDWVLRFELTQAGPVNSMWLESMIIKDVCTECYGRIQALAEHLAEVHASTAEPSGVAQP